MRKFFRSHWIMEEVMRLTIFIALICFLFGMGSHYVDFSILSQMNSKLLSCFVFAILTWIFFGCGILSFSHSHKKYKDYKNELSPFDILGIGCCISAAAFGIAFLFCLHEVVHNILY